MTDDAGMNDDVLAFEAEQGPEMDLTIFERLMGLALDASGDNSAYDDPRFVEWLMREAHEQMTPAERRDNERAAAAFARRMQPILRAARVGESLPNRALNAHDATVVGEIRQVADAAALAGCAPWLPTLSVAAGAGRELWDEPCDRWIELPPDVPHGRYVALGVAGDSMTPYLKHGDTILVDTRAKLAEDSIVVARRPEDGYVVKYVSRLTRAMMELSSFNAEYSPFTIARDRDAVVGVVAARLSATSD